MSKLDLKGYRDPPIFQPPSWREWLLVLAVAAIVIAAVVSVGGAEAEKPEIWITTTRFPGEPPTWCRYCNIQHDEIAEGALKSFTIHYIRGENGVPYIAYWKDSSYKRAGYFRGWNRGFEKPFMAQWRRDIQR